MIAEAGAVLSSINAAMDIAKGYSSLKSESDRNTAVINMQRALLEALEAAQSDKQAISGLREEISVLRRALAKREDWDLDRQRYELTESETGVLTYQLKAEQANGQPLHRLCVACFENDRKSVLQVRAKARGGEMVECQICKKEMILSRFDDPVITIPRRRPNDDFW